MKRKISICIEEETLRKIEEELSKNIFRSRSHVVEFAINEKFSGGIKNAP